MSVTQPAFYFLMNLAGMLIYWISSVMIQQGGLNIGQLVAFMDYLFHVMFSIMLFCLVFMMYPKPLSAQRGSPKYLTQGLRWTAVQMIRLGRSLLMRFNLTM